MVSMANNHALDYGASGLTDTLRARASSRLPIVGNWCKHGRCDQTLVKDVRGQASPTSLG